MNPLFTNKEVSLMKSSSRRLIILQVGPAKVIYNGEVVLKFEKDVVLWSYMQCP